MRFCAREDIMPIDRETSPPSDDDLDDADGCLCGLEHLDDDATSDLELPTASGGIEVSVEELPADDEDDVDGCDLDFAEVDHTADEELPVTVGGV
jgi:hypothetical protein